MLRSIELTNFKCFEHLRLDCRPINLLCGVNGMGKSSVIQALLVIRQSFESGELDRGRLALGGDRVDLGSESDVLFEDAERDVLGFGLESDETDADWRVDFGYGAYGDQLTAIQSETHLTDYAPDDWRTVPPFGGSMVYVNAERVGPRKIYPTSEMLSTRRDFGPNSEYAWSYLDYHQGSDLPAGDSRCVEPDSRFLVAVVNQWLQDVSPGARIEMEEARAADAVIVGFTFERSGAPASRRHRATNVGFGLSYALPVILGLLSPSETLMAVENPESHLHPRGQTKLAELAVRAATEGVQVFAETHSDHFMDGVRIAVRDGLIAPEDVAFHYFDRVDGRAVVTSPRVDSDGRLSSWPAGFFDQHEENLARLIAPRH